ncbi:MAG: zf-HC2 domain-containing protein [Holophagaceae bacterium]|nr:zf-HC2 domain-containing protein [Holophagaceae bacterium]
MTRHVLHQLPLWVEGDLDAAGMAAVDRHLAQCPDCASAAGALRASQDLLREAMVSPFTTADRERLRGRVLAQVRVEASTKPTRRLIPRPALLAVGAATLLFTVILWRQEPTVAIPEPRPAPTAPQPPPEPPPAVAFQRGPLPLRIRESAATPGKTTLPAIPTRIEFQTADPTIRIIWLAQSNPLPDTTPSMEETL